MIRERENESAAASRLVCATAGRSNAAAGSASLAHAANRGAGAERRISRE
jgi:hypothetical protein